MSCGGLALAHICAGRVVLHSCFQQGLWLVSPENTGEGDTPALLLSPRRKEETTKKMRTVLAMFLRTLVVALIIGMPFVLLAGHGYCWKCNCNEFDKDVWRSNGTDYVCKCGHKYDHHYNTNRPVTFGSGFNSSRYSPHQEKEGFFDDGMNVMWTIGAIIAIIAIVVTRDPAVMTGGGLVVCMFVKALLKFIGAI